MAVVSSGPTLAIAHEWLVRYAGSERVVEQMRAEFPQARLHTTLLRPDALPPDLRVAETGLLQRLTRARLPHEPLVRDRDRRPGAHDRHRGSILAAGTVPAR